MLFTFDLACSLRANNDAAGGGGGGTPVIWNSADKTTNVTLTNDDKTATANTNNYESARTTVNDFATTGSRKSYLEIAVSALGLTSDLVIGLKLTSDTITSGVSWTNGTYALWRGSGAYHPQGGWSATGSAPPNLVAGVIAMIAIDEAAGKVWFGLNGSWNNSGDPSAGTNPSFSSMPAGNHAMYFSTDNEAGAVELTIVSAPGDLTYSVPTGFTAGA